MKPLSGIASHLIYAVLWVISLCMLSGCANGNHSGADKPTFATPIEKAQNMEAWKKEGALKTNIRVAFGGRTSLDATLMVETHGPGIRMEMGGDTVAVFDGKNMWVMPSDSAINPFTLKTWAYFLKAPYKLEDPGTHIQPQGTAMMKGQTYDTAKLTFDSGIGDSPKDWFVLYRSQDTNRLDAMAYIVTYGGKTVEEASKNPHAISYEGFKILDDVPIATTWKFWHWNAQKGFSDESIGMAQLTNMQFVNAGNMFARPKGAIKMKR